ncbi:hypothetical protein JCM3770_002993 [Rhodotorula araucariae]
MSVAKGVVQNCDACRMGRNKCDRLETCSECVGIAFAFTTSRTDSHALTQNRLEIARLKAQVAILLRVAHVTADELPRLLARVAQDDPVVLPVPRAPVPTAVDRDEWDEPHSLMSLCRAAEASDASSETSDLAPRGDGSRYWRAPSADETHAPSSSADSRASSLASFSGNLSMSVYGRASLAPGELQQILTKVPSVSGNGHSSRAGSSPVPSLGM